MTAKIVVHMLQISSGNSLPNANLEHRQVPYFLQIWTKAFFRSRLIAPTRNSSHCPESKSMYLPMLLYCLFKTIMLLPLIPPRQFKMTSRASIAFCHTVLPVLQSYQILTSRRFDVYEGLYNRSSLVALWCPGAPRGPQENPRITFIFLASFG